MIQVLKKLPRNLLISQWNFTEDYGMAVEYRLKNVFSCNLNTGTGNARSVAIGNVIESTVNVAVKVNPTHSKGSLRARFMQERTQNRSAERKPQPGNFVHKYAGSISSLPHTVCWKRNIDCVHSHQLWYFLKNFSYQLISNISSYIYLLIELSSRKQINALMNWGLNSIVSHGSEFHNSFLDPL